MKSPEDASGPGHDKVSSSSDDHGTIYAGAAAVARLRMLDLDHDELVEVVLHSEMARHNTSKLDPPGADGMMAYYAAVRKLSEILLSRDDEDWERSDDFNIPRLVNKQTSVAVVISGADAAAGLRGRRPRSQNEKGARFADIVRVNQEIVSQIPLFKEPRFWPLPRLEEQITWALLYYTDEIGTRRAEVSIPVGVDENGRLAKWRERIILDIPKFDGSGLSHDADDDGDAQVDVVVTPRG